MRDRNAFVDGIRVVQSVVLERERLVEGLNAIEDKETEDEGSKYMPR